MQNLLKKIGLIKNKKDIRKVITYSTRTSIMGFVVSKLGVNKKFHKFKDDYIDNDMNSIISPVDAKVVALGNIKNGGRIISKSNKEISLMEVLGKDSSLFSGGFYINLYLSPKNRHYWRVPYNSKLISMSINEGKATIPVFIGLDKIFKNKDFFKKAIKRNANIGMIFKTKYFSFAMIPVGSLNVNGIHIINEHKNVYKKGDIGGYFSIGSSMLLCFPKYPLKSLVSIGDKVKIGDKIVNIVE